TRFLIHEQIAPGTNNVPMCVRVNDAYDDKRVRTVLQVLVARHGLLRCVFDPGGLSQREVADATIELTTCESMRDRAKEANDRMSHIAASAFKERFDLTRLPLFKCEAFPIDESLFYLVVLVHHIICDGHSGAVLLREFSNAYKHLTS